MKKNRERKDQGKTKLSGRKCKLCDRPAMSRHHIFPVVHFGKMKNRETYPLCDHHHQIADAAILAVEAFMGETRYGTRYKMQPIHYVAIAKTLRLR